MIEPPTLRLISAENDQPYVLGFPAYFALTIGAEPPDASLLRVPVIGWQGTRGMIGIELSPGGSTEVIHRILPRAVVSDGMGIPLTRLRFGERRRMLVDLTEVLPESLDPGVYLAVVHFGPESLRVTTPPTRLEFRRPTTREHEARAQVADQVEAKGSWGQWTRLPPSPGSQLRLPWGPDDPLRLNWIFKDLYFGHDRLPTIPLDRLDVLGGLFAAEREALRAELLAVRDDAAAFERQAQEVKRDYPGLAAWMEAIVAGESEIAWTRGQRGSP